MATYKRHYHAEGLLRHRFWGEYSAHIVLEFADPSSAAAALESGALGEGWQRKAQWLHWTGDSVALETVSDTLAAHGANRSAIASLRRSVDYGEPFEVSVGVEDSRQLQLIGGAS